MNDYNIRLEELKRLLQSRNPEVLYTPPPKHFGSAVFSLLAFQYDWGNFPPCLISCNNINKLGGIYDILQGFPLTI